MAAVARAEGRGLRGHSAAFPRPAGSLASRWGPAVALWAAVLVAAGSACGQVVNATWTDGAGNARYEDPNNWDIGVVPVNDGNDAYSVVIPGGMSVEFDVDGPQIVTDLELGSGSTLNVKAGKSLTILDDARIYGTITSVGGVLEAGAVDAEFRGNKVQVSISGGAQVHVAASTYTSTGLNTAGWTYTLFSASGTDVGGTASLLDLSSLTSINASFNDNHSGASTYHDIRATGGARIDLSGVEAISGAVGANDRLRIYVNAQGDVDLSSLQRIQSGYTDLYVSKPAFELPELLSAVGTLFELSGNCQASLPKAEAFSSTSVDLEEGTTSLSVPSLISHNGGAVTLREGTQLDAPSLETMNGVTLNVDVGGTFLAPNMASFTGGVFERHAGQVLDLPAFVNIDNSRLSVRDGELLTVAAGSYTTTGLASAGWTYTLLAATGTDGNGTPSRLDLSAVTDLDARFNDNHTGASTYHDIRASGDGQIDLSGLQTMAGPGHPTDRLRIYVNTGGSIDLSSLQRITSGYTDFYLSAAAFELAELRSVSGSTLFDLAAGTTSLSVPALISHNGGTVTIREGTTVDAPSLEAMDGVTLNVEQGGTFLAPNMATFTRGEFHRHTGQVLDVQPWVNVDNSQLYVSDGETLTVAAGSYSSTGLTGVGATYTLLSASGTDGGVTPSHLDAASVRDIDAGFQDGRNDVTTHQVIEATDNGRIDLSGLETIAGAAHSSDRLRIDINSGGSIDLSGLQRITSGYTDFYVFAPTFELPELRSTSGTLFDLNTNCQATFAKAATFSGTSIDLEAGTTSLSVPSLISHNGGSYKVREGTTFDAPSLETMNGVTLDVDVGGTFLAPNMASFTGGVFDRRAGQVLELPPFLNIDDSQLSVRDGETLTVAAGSYSSTGLNGAGASYTLLSASGTDGNGTPSRLDAPNLGDINAGFYDYRNDVATRQIIEASVDGVVDLSGLESIVGPQHSTDSLILRANTGGTLDVSSLRSIRSAGTGRTRLEVGQQGQLLLGDLVLTDRADFVLTDATSTLAAGDFHLSASGTLSVAALATMRITGSWLFSGTTEGSVGLDQSILHMAGAGLQFLEVGGQDLDANGSSSGNFGIGQLVVGQEGIPTTVQLVDLLDNGNRTPSRREALYLCGLPGEDGLVLHEGSTLIMDRLNVYAYLDANWVHLNSLFEGEVTELPFDGGTLVVPEPATLVLLSTVVLVGLGRRLGRAR